MRAYNGTVTLELSDAERETLGKFYDLVSRGILSNLSIDDVYSLLESIGLKQDYSYSENNNLSIDIKYI